MSVLASSFATCRPQRLESRIDSAHSTASLSLVSSQSGISWNVGIAKVSGTVILDNNNPGEDVLDLNIYPARQEARLLNPDGSFRKNSSADLSRYTLMSFHSSSAKQNRDGKVAVTGELTVTYVNRETSIVWSDAYSGPDYGEPVAQRWTGEVTFVLGAPTPVPPTAIKKSKQITALAILNRQDFPGLRTAWLEAIWPIVVEDEHCEMPPVKPSMRDYSGAVCTGTPIEVTPLSRPQQRIGADYPGPNEVTAPESDAATILIHLRLANRPSGPNGR
jgi:YceI-like domain